MNSSLANPICCSQSQKATKINKWYLCKTKLGSVFRTKSNENRKLEAKQNSLKWMSDQRAGIEHQNIEQLYSHITKAYMPQTSVAKVFSGWLSWYTIICTTHTNTHIHTHTYIYRRIHVLVIQNFSKFNYEKYWLLLIPTFGSFLRSSTP